ncbi:LysR family transcriptional regulator [Acidihalobacter yilgarnensis]|uniref:LysR family transcriptional regulator n=1 Tax=Acidihalobacter yilgarnensis TaxID=2819280 RepID=A0A1D8ILZ7_9GAMM|nr:LysR family transcriptional regulator [Acidihalobacter yilgarnensis]AOU97480.1 LysR family transcriptional regulator [Acidihalobacter yilgarnensis]
MDISALQAFIAVAEQNSFSLAADALHLTQPAVSKRIKLLEEELGSRLFDRLARRVQLTEAGQALLPGARRILLEVAESRRRLSNLDGRVAGVLSIGTSHHIGLHRLPGLLRSYTRRYPEVDLDLHFMDSEAGCAAVEHGDLELALVTLPPETLPRLRCTPVWDDPLTLVAAPDHPLTTLPAPIELVALARYPAILPAVGTYTRGVIERALATHGLSPKVRLDTNYLETIRSMVSIGLGWSALPEILVDDSIRAVEVEGLSLRRTLGFVRHRERTLSNAAQALMVAATGKPEALPPDAKSAKVRG